MKKVMLVLMLGVISLCATSFDSSDSKLIAPEVVLNCNDVAAADWQEAVNAGITDNETLNTIFQVSYFYCENFLNPR